MKARFRVFGHPLHPILNVFPAALFSVAIICDLLYFALGTAKWAHMAYWCIGAGIIGGVIAAPWGFFDWRTIPEKTRAKRVGAIHGIGNLMAVALFAISWALRGARIESPGVW